MFENNIKQIISSVKKSIFLKIYLSLIFLTNFTYVFFEVLKSSHVEKSLLAGRVEENQFEYLLNISKITNFLEVLLIAIVLIYLIVIFIKREKFQIKHFILIYLSFFISFLFINYMISFIFSAPSGNLTQQLIIPLAIILLVTIYSLVTSLYKRTIKIDAN